MDGEKGDWLMGEEDNLLPFFTLLFLLTFLSARNLAACCRRWLM